MSLIANNHQQRITSQISMKIIRYAVCVGATTGTCRSFTLPGIAGVALTLGMAVDCNIIFSNVSAKR